MYEKILERSTASPYLSVDHLPPHLPAALPARRLFYRLDQHARSGRVRCLYLLPLWMEPGARRGISLERIRIPQDRGLHQPAVGVSQRRLGVIGYGGTLH